MMTNNVAGEGKPCHLPWSSPATANEETRIIWDHPRIDVQRPIVRNDSAFQVGPRSRPRGILRQAPRGRLPGVIMVLQAPARQRKG